MEIRVQANDDTQLDLVQGVWVPPSLEDRTALSRYMQEMAPRTAILHEEVRAINRLTPKIPPPWPPEIMNQLITRFAALERHVDGAAMVVVPRLALRSHPKWLRWAETASRAGIVLSHNIQGLPSQGVRAAFLAWNDLSDQLDDVVSPEMEMWCLEDCVLQLPISDEEYEEMLLVRRSNSYSRRGTPAWDRWSRMSSRHLYQYPTSLEKECVHEAGHIVVGHYLGWRAQSIDRHPDGTPFAVVEPPCEFPELSIEEYSAVAVAGFVAEDLRFCRTIPTTDHVKMARQLSENERRAGRDVTAELKLANALQAEARAREILTREADKVTRIANRAMQGLPVQRETLLAELLNEVLPNRPVD